MAMVILGASIMLIGVILGRCMSGGIASLEEIAKWEQEIDEINKQK